MHQLNQIVEADADLGHELLVGQKQVRNQCHLDLRENGVLRVAKEGLDLEILLDKPKENLDLPMLLVDVGNGSCQQRHVVDEELEGLPVS